MFEPYLEKQKLFAMCLKFILELQGFLKHIYIYKAFETFCPILRSMARLVCDMSSTLRLSFFQYGSIALISGVAAGRNFSVRPSVISTSRRIIFARCCGALSSIMQIFPNLRTAALRNLAKTCMSNLSYCLNILLLSVVSNPNTMVFACKVDVSDVVCIFAKDLFG